jgi:hypothetical protein
LIVNHFFLALCLKDLIELLLALGVNFGAAGNFWLKACCNWGADFYLLIDGLIGHFTWSQTLVVSLILLLAH